MLSSKWCRRHAIIITYDSHNTLLVPSLFSKLISMGQLTKELNCVILIYPDYCIFQDIQTKKILGRGTRRGGLYYLDTIKTGECLLSVDSTNSKEKIWLWHKRLGHLSFGYMQKLFHNFFIGLNNEQFTCETCIKAKSHRSTYLANNNKKIAPFDLIHTDVWGPSPIMSKYGYRWYLSLTDDCSRMIWLYVLKTKAEVKKMFKDFITMVKTQFGIDIKVIRSDNGTEYVNQELQLYFKEKGILHETSCVGTPQQNGVAERKNRHILEISRALLIESHVPKIFWDSAVLFAVYLMNRTPTRVNDFKTPLQVFSEHMKLNSVLNLIPKIFGCTVYVHLQKEFRSKLDPEQKNVFFWVLDKIKKGLNATIPLHRNFISQWM
jgi:transposase InsO family protein